MSTQHTPQAIAWLHEDTLPAEYPYDAMYPYSRVDGVRLFPVFGPCDQCYSAADMATAAADGFRAGVASTQKGGE